MQSAGAIASKSPRAPVIARGHMRMHAVPPPEEAESTGIASLHAGQLAAYLSTAPITIVSAGIRGGKTHVGALKMIGYAIENPCDEDETHLVCSPTYSMSKVPVEKIFKLLYDKTLFPICPLIRYAKSDRTFILAAANGGISKVSVRSLHDPDRIRGIKAKSAWLDEGAYISREAWFVVQGRLADSAGPCWITTTPAGYNWIFDLYEQWKAEVRDGVPRNERGVAFIHFSSLANTFLADRAGFERLLASYDARTYQQEVEAKFTRGRGLVYHAFSRRFNGRPGKIDPALPLWIGQDFNVGMMASVIGQPWTNADSLSGVHVKAERLAPDSDTFGLVQWLDGFIAKNRIPKERVTIFADASGKNRATTGRSDHQILRAAGYRVDAPQANPMVKDRVNCVNGLLRSVGSKYPRLVVDTAACPQTTNAMEKQIWEPESDPPTPDKDHGFDHPVDALGYMCWRKFPLRMRSSTGRTTRRAA